MEEPLPVRVRVSGGKTLIAPLPQPAPGEHTAVWRILSGDGHVTEGKTRFTVIEHRGLPLVLPLWAAAALAAATWAWGRWRRR